MHIKFRLLTSTHKIAKQPFKRVLTSTITPTSNSKTYVLEDYISYMLHNYSIHDRTTHYPMH